MGEPGAGQSLDIERLMTRAKELEASGKHHSEAFGIAALESRIAGWPSPGKSFDGILRVLLYGDFRPPKEPLVVEELGLTVDTTPTTGSFIRAMCVLPARITVANQTLEAVCDAARRLDLFAGVWVLAHWAHGPVRWWSWVTHGTQAAASDELDKEEFLPALRLAREIENAEVQLRVRAALYWLQEPQQGMLDGPQPNALRLFTAYWSAFECLVSAVTTWRPMHRSTRAEKQAAIDALIRSWGGDSGASGSLTSFRIKELHKVVEPGLRQSAAHVFSVLFHDPEQVAKYMHQCFDRADRRNRLYQVRNDISHGNIDASDLLELIRVEARVHELWMIVWGMVGRLLPFGAPVDRDFPVRK